MIRLGEYNKLNVIRKSDLGYMLGDGHDEILMHFKQSTKELKDGEEVTVFVYSDKEKRMTGTMIEPLVTVEHEGFVDVVEVLPGVGVFVNINTPKDILISKDYLPFKESDWPVAGDKLLIRLKLKNDFISGKPLNRYEIVEIKSPVVYTEYEHVNGYVARIAEKGLGIVTVDKIYVFVPLSQYRGAHRLGEAVEVTITKNLDGECYGTMNAHKEILMDEDKELILKYLQDHHGLMNLTAKSSSEDVESTLKMSRKAFKRALGGLYKDRLVECTDTYTKLLQFKKEN